MVFYAKHLKKFYLFEGAFAKAKNTANGVKNRFIYADFCGFRCFIITILLAQNQLQIPN